MTVTIYTVAGTGHSGDSGAANTGSNGFPALIGSTVNQTLYDWVPVGYPAGFPFVDSVSTGVATLTDLIDATPGKFALVGYSQGAMVTSTVLQAMQSGSLTARMSDCIAAVAFGNPMRQAGHTFPGCPDPGYHGIECADHRLTNTPAWWWDFAVPHDLAACVGDDLTGQWLTEIFMVFCGVFEIHADIGTFLATFRHCPFQVIMTFAAILPYLIGPNPSAANPIGAPHGKYGSYAPLPRNPLTCVQLAVQYLNAAAWSVANS